MLSSWNLEKLIEELDALKRLRGVSEYTLREVRTKNHMTVCPFAAALGAIPSRGPATQIPMSSLVSRGKPTGAQL
jgi:hypothetical protein